MRKSTINLLVILGVAAVVLMAFTATAAAQDAATMTPDEVSGRTKAMVVVGCMLAMGITGIASALGIGLAGSSAVAVAAEKPELFGKCLLLQALPMTQGVYGLLTAILLMLGAGILGGEPKVDLTNPMYGTMAVGIGLVIGLTGISAIGQAMTASSSIGATARNPDVFGRGIIYTAMSETLAIFGLLVGILIMSGVGFL